MNNETYEERYRRLLTPPPTPRNPGKKATAERRLAYQVALENWRAESQRRYVAAEAVKAEAAAFPVPAATVSITLYPYPHIAANRQMVRLVRTVWAIDFAAESDPGALIAIVPFTYPALIEVWEETGETLDTHIGSIVAFLLSAPAKPARGRRGASNVLNRVANRREARFTH